MKIIVLFFTFICSILFSAQTVATCNASLLKVKPTSIYSDYGNGTVIDKLTGLMWQKCSLGLSGADCTTGTALTFTWQAALAAAINNTGNGYSDWRLPNKNELNTLVEDACYSAAINATIFPSTISVYWTSTATTNISSTGQDVWVIDFSSGNVKQLYKNSSNYVRLVRGSY